jgi:hypothetical protein
VVEIVSAMRITSYFLATLGLSAALAPAALAQSGSTREGPLWDRIVHLPSGDSVQVQSSIPAVVPNAPTGLLLTFHPFFPLTDSARVRAVAVALFQGMLAHTDTALPPFVVLRAVDKSSAERIGAYRMSAFGVVLERHADGVWYFLNETKPAFAQPGGPAAPPPGR